MAKTSTGAYHPVVTDLRAKIAGGDLRPGDMLPSESQIMSSYAVTRYSAREAIKRLAADGLVVVVDGRGSHVRARTERARHNDTRALHTAPGTTGRTVDAEFAEWTDTEPPTTYRTTATTDVALTIGVPEHAPLFAVDRLRHRADTDATTDRRLQHRLIVPMATCSRVPDLDPFGTPDDLYAALADADIAVTTVEMVRAVAATPDDSAALRITPNSPVLVTRRILRDDHGTTLAMEETRRNGDDAQFSYTLTPTPGPPVVPNLAPVGASRGRSRRKAPEQ